MEFVIREAESLEDALATEELQVAAWNFSDREVVPHSSMIVARHTGGLVALAFVRGQPVGFVYGLAACEGEKRWQHSHMLAVHPEYQGTGVAPALKWFQRDWALTRGIPLVTWTFDPLLTKNARLNFGKLGAYADTYYEDFYGIRTGLYAGLPADRLYVKWELDHPRVVARAQGRVPPPPEPEGAPLNRTAGEGVELRPVEVLPPEEGKVYLEVPYDIEAIKKHDMELARAWRLHTREAFKLAFSRGYRAVDLARRGQRVFYQLERA
jgi:predicted GNAT superfamily acetyltransferase